MIRTLPKREGGRAVYSDLGLRTLEASFIRDGFSEEEVAVVHPLDLKKMISDETRIIAVGAHDPLGINPPASTFVDIARTGPPYNRIKFLELMKNPLLSSTTTIVGGKGAWQVSDPAVMEKLHIDHIHTGMGEVSMPRACRQSPIRGMISSWGASLTSATPAGCSPAPWSSVCRGRRRRTF